MALDILIIDDSKLLRAQLIDSLKMVGLFRNYYEAQDGIEGLKVLNSVPVDMIICDLLMPKMDGIKFLAKMKGTMEYRDIPVIFLSAQGESKMKIKALGNGASDYITKPFDKGELIARIMVHLNIKALQDDMRNTNRLLKELSITDHLTRLYNRRYIINVLEMELNRTLRKKGALSLVIIDVDHFKCVNDTYGHQMGDIVLTEIANSIQSELRNYDIAARYGGEEFAMLLPETALKDGILVAERVRRSVGGIGFPPPLEEVSVTISLGVAALPSPHLNSVDALIRAADEALYRAKQNGRNRVEAMLLRSSDASQDQI